MHILSADLGRTDDLVIRYLHRPNGTRLAMLPLVIIHAPPERRIKLTPWFPSGPEASHCRPWPGYAMLASPHGG